MNEVNQAKGKQTQNMFLSDAIIKYTLLSLTYNQESLPLYTVRFATEVQYSNITKGPQFYSSHTGNFNR